MKLSNYIGTTYLPYIYIHVADYIVDSFLMHLSDCYNGNPFLTMRFAPSVSSARPGGTIEAGYGHPLNRLMSLLKLDEINRKNLDLLEPDGTLVIATGQQPITYGCPLLVINKTMTAIPYGTAHQSRPWSQRCSCFFYGRRFQLFRKCRVLTLA